MLSFGRGLAAASVSLAGPRRLRDLIRPAARRTLFIRTEETPNEHSLKFLPGQTVIPDGSVREFLSPNAARRESPLADELLRIEGVKGVLFGSNFIAVNKGEEYEWKHVKPAVFATLMEYLSMGKPVLQTTKAEGEEEKAVGGERKDDETLAGLSAEDRETVLMIKEILDTRIRPTVQEDGGDVQFVSFRDGVVELQLRGACRSCSSSVVTLKHGIENMLMHYIPEVKEVRQVEDAGEQASQEYFAKIEHSLEHDDANDDAPSPQTKSPPHTERKSERD